MARVSLPEKTCERCGVTFTPRRGKPGRFCSLTCSRGKLDLTGQRFGRLVVLSEGPRSGCHPRWHCRCDCGNETLVHQVSLRGGGTQSCGCIWLATISGPKITRRNPARHTPEFLCWQGMVRRCTETQAPNFHLYGGRGITVCERWQSFDAFIADLGPRPSMKHTLDRVDVNGPYEPGNVRWATPTVQQGNRRNNRRLTFQDETLTVTEWARRLDLDRRIIYRRLNSGWSINDALTTPGRTVKRPAA